jgi:hypothetical protein
MEYRHSRGDVIKGAKTTTKAKKVMMAHESRVLLLAPGDDKDSCAHTTSEVMVTVRRAQAALLLDFPLSIG